MITNYFKLYMQYQIDLNQALLQHFDELEMTEVVNRHHKLLARAKELQVPVDIIAEEIKEYEELLR